jgi:LmbE family N-acetylglucosaminyl deacetylase
VSDADRLDLIVLSPHLDDGALSCGGRIAATAERGGRALLVTVFAGDEAPEPASPLATRLREVWNLPPGGVVEARRAEDREAARRLGASVAHWNLPEALYRLDATGARPLYGTVEALYGDPDAADLARLDELASRIAALPPAALLLAPLGVGGHVDHRLVRTAAERSGRDLAFYEEFPYSEWKWFAVRRALERPREWASESLPLSATLADVKRDAILAYRSQVGALFRTEGRLGKQLRRHARRAGGERIWRRRPAPAAR